MAPTPEMEELIEAMNQLWLVNVVLGFIMFLIYYLTGLWISVQRMRMIRLKLPTEVVDKTNMPYEVQGNDDGESDEGEKFIGSRKFPTYQEV